MDMDDGICPNCGRPFIERLTPEEITDRLQDLESTAVMALELNLGSPDERVRQQAAKMLLEFSRGKPKQSVEQTTDQVTRIVYETAAWYPDPELPGPLAELEEGDGGDTEAQG